MIHTTFRLCFEIEAERYRGKSTNDDLFATFKSTPMRFAARPTPEPPYPAGSIIRLHATLLHRPVWLSSQEGADERWQQILLPQTRDILTYIQRDFARCSQPRPGRETPLHELRFDRFDLQVDPYLISIANPEPWTIGDVMGYAQQFRDFLNRDAFGTTAIARVDVPFIDMAALWKTYDQEHAAADDAASDQSAAACAETGAEAAANARDATTDTGADYTVWGITFSDGTFRKFDSVIGDWYREPAESDADPL